MSLFTAQLHPGRALGYLVLGASLHDILTRVKAEPQQFPKINVTYSRTDPVRDRVLVDLPANGLRLQFDGPEQRLRLVEVLDFSKNHIYLKPANDKERDLVRPASIVSGLGTSPQPAENACSGPTFRHIYQRFLGPTYDGEYIPDKTDPRKGLYVLSYPGVAFTFSMPRYEYSSDKDVVSLLSSSSNPRVPKSMAVFSGASWAQARPSLYTEVLPSIKSFIPLAAKGKDACPDEVSLVKIHGGGKLQLFRRWTNNATWITLGETSPQQLVAELGPPDAIYRKNEQKMYIHKLRAASNTVARPQGNDLKRQDDLTDTDQSSINTASDGYDTNDEAVEDDAVASVSGECFYNYFYLGFDILVSTPTTPSPVPPSQAGGNTYLLKSNGQSLVNAETRFTNIEKALREALKSTYPSEAEAKQKQRGMVLNRGWGDSPGSSCELLGGWEESGAREPGVGGKKFDGSEESTTTLYGFPGLVFEVLKNGFYQASRGVSKVGDLLWRKDIDSSGVQTPVPTYMDGVRAADARLNAVLSLPKPPRPYSGDTKALRHWSITGTDMPLRAPLSKREAARLRALILSSGIRAKEIERRARDRKLLTSPKAGPAIKPLLPQRSAAENLEPFSWAAVVELCPDPAAQRELTTRPVAKADMYRVAGHVLGQSIQAAGQQWQGAADVFATQTAPELHARVEALRTTLAGTLSERTRRAADEADEVIRDLAVGQRLQVKRVEDVMENMLRRKRRRFRWARRATWLVIEWFVVGCMWWLWFLYLLWRSVAGIGRGVVGGMRWLLWL
ncbi:hypothetical protein P8C59_002925 [Phyllachora maydis]|uniref:Uncharacterized protein n=1 Tax=Phyllachora maydis TaxID=1825666 RepID=A0AAD9I0Q5_9PEZI|nr:hypothetical protein P8C59_002925 [Phyllachora maydis]